jgi:hypothetical protein
MGYIPARVLALTETVITAVPIPGLGMESLERLTTMPGGIPDTAKSMVFLKPELALVRTMVLACEPWATCKLPARLATVKLGGSA